MDAQQQAIELALAQAKRVNRESRLLVQTLARIRDKEYLQPEDPAQGAENGDKANRD